MIPALIIFTIIGIFIYRNQKKRYDAQQKLIQKYDFINENNFFDFFQHINDIPLQQQLISKIRIKNKEIALHNPNNTEICVEMKNIMNGTFGIYWKTIISSFEDDSYAVFIQKLEQLKNNPNVSNELKKLIINLIGLWDDTATNLPYGYNPQKAKEKLMAYNILFSQLEKKNFLE